MNKDLMRYRRCDDDEKVNSIIEDAALLQGSSLLLPAVQTANAENPCAYFRHLVHANASTKSKQLQSTFGFGDFGYSIDRIGHKDGMKNYQVL